MTRMLTLALALSLSAVAIGCGDTPVQPGQPRALATFTPSLNTALTPSSARAIFGAPDEQQGSGLIIYVYRLADGRRLFLGFPGEAPIVYAKIVGQDGTVTDLPLDPARTTR